MSDVLEQARSLASEGRVGAAIEMLEQAVAAGEESGEICKEIARLCLSVNEVRAFQNWCHEAMRVDPNDPEPNFMIGQLFCIRGRWEEAVETLQHAIEMGLAGGQREEADRLLPIARLEATAIRRRGFSNL